MSYYPNLSILTVLSINVAILYYINFVNQGFKFKFPKLYVILSIVCYLFIIICILFLMSNAIHFLSNYTLKSSRGQPSESSGPSSNPGGPSGSGNPGGPNKPGNPLGKVCRGRKAKPNLTVRTALQTDLEKDN